MNVRRLLPSAAFGLSLLGLGAWAYGVFWPITDVRVVNHSGETLRHLRLCIHECAGLEELRPGRSWRVPLTIRNDGGASLTFDGLRDEFHANAYVTPGLGVHFVVEPGGRIRWRY
ncbi:hypothetical protein DAETH_16390 [Deinococcus aetherius]|uniref:Uncharacterized protein n=1 Tax=Deinococcus aetherius TaxID=200252 RepID=A0ABM8AD07_9DEIO|nr:hypothetical protein [Deinococcus aetherius]BDP41670.1 hypothetical protein DAETH_16390 [Deinococcus aetherius]